MCACFCVRVAHGCAQFCWLVCQIVSFRLALGCARKRCAEGLGVMGGAATNLRASARGCVKNHPHPHSRDHPHAHTHTLTCACRHQCRKTACVTLCVRQRISLLFCRRVFVVGLRGGAAPWCAIYNYARIWAAEGVWTTDCMLHVDARSALALIAKLARRGFGKRIII